MVEFDFSDATSVADINRTYTQYYAETWGEGKPFAPDEFEQWWSLQETARQAYERFPAERLPIDLEAEALKHKEPKDVYRFKMTHNAKAEGTRKQSKRSVTKVPSEAGIIRAWARENGFTVGERGRLHPTVLAAYVAACAARND